jgi:hypothetical protein
MPASSAEQKLKRKTQKIHENINGRIYVIITHASRTQSPIMPKSYALAASAA